MTSTRGPSAAIGRRCRITSVTVMDEAPRRFLHIANRSATTDLIVRAGIPGETSIWADPLHEGPVPGAIDHRELCAVRARHIARAPDDAPYEEVLAELASWEEAIARSAVCNERVLWFEHDLFDQLNLIHLLDRIAAFPSRPWHNADRASESAKLRPRTFCTFRARDVVTRSQTLLIVFGGVERRAGTADDHFRAHNGPPAQRYDHRLRHLVQRTGDVTLAMDLGVPRSTARRSLACRQRSRSVWMLWTSLNRSSDRRS